MKKILSLTMLVILTACSGGGGATVTALNPNQGASPVPSSSPSPTPSASPSPSPSPSASPTPYAYSGGSGTMADPWMLSVPEDVQRIADNPSAYFKLKQSINMGSYSFTMIPTFSGTLYGDNYELDNLTIAGAAPDTAMFGVMTGTIVQVKMLNASISGAGLAAGFAANLKGLISSCQMTGTVTSPSGGNGFNTGTGRPFYVQKNAGGSIVSSTQDVYYNGNRVNSVPN